MLWPEPSFFGNWSATSRRRHLVILRMIRSLALVLLSHLLSTVLCETEGPFFSFFFVMSLKLVGGPIGEFLVHNKVLFYSPAVIGVDPHRNRVDLYTSYFTNLHEVCEFCWLWRAWDKSVCSIFYSSFSARRSLYLFFWLWTRAAAECVLSSVSLRFRAFARFLISLWAWPVSSSLLSVVVFHL